MPPTCILCDSPGYRRLDICHDCYTNLPRNFPCCPQCAANLPNQSPNPAICGDCQVKHPAFDKTLAFFKYQQSMRFLIAQLKFNKQYKNARLLGSLLAAELHDLPERPEAIIPVPLHPHRYRERRFNQCTEIGFTVAKQLHIPLLANHCIRHRNTPHQTELSKTERLKNMRNAFSLKQPVTAKHVAILDDVMTTGSTLHELALLLKKSGVQRVDAWVCARA